MTKGKEPPRGWVFTGKTLRDNLKEGGVLNRYYREPETNSIYQLMNIVKKGIKPDYYLEAKCRFVNPENPARSQVVNVYGSMQREYDCNLVSIINDRELKIK